MRVSWYINRAISMMRGSIINIFYGLNASNLIVGGKIKISRPKKNTTLKLGKNVKLFSGVKFFLDEEGATIQIGDNTYINRRSEICCKKSVSIGNNCAISWDVTILDTDYHSLNENKIDLPVVIKDNVWVGCKSTILKGVTIGNGAVIAAGSLVTSDVPPKCLVGGVPAKILKENIEWN